MGSPECLMSCVWPWLFLLDQTWFVDQFSGLTLDLHYYHNLLDNLDTWSNLLALWVCLAWVLRVLPALLLCLAPCPLENSWSLLCPVKMKLSSYRTDLYGFQASSVTVFLFNINFLFNATVSNALQLRNPCACFPQLFFRLFLQFIIYVMYFHIAA